MIAIERKKLEQVLDDLICASSYCNTYDAIDVVKEALAQPEQEPVFLIYDDAGGWIESNESEYRKTEEVNRWLLYTTPPQRPWVGLTAQEAADCWTTSATKTWHNFETALKEKNT